MDTVYIETTVVGHLTGRPHPNERIASRQQISREWWSTAASHYDLLISELVLSECGDGDPAAAKDRLQALEGISLLAATEEVDVLAQALIDNHAVSATEVRDAFHISLAAVHGVQYLVSWNFKHILNPAVQAQIALVCRKSGFEPAVLCTPEQLLESQNDH